MALTELQRAICRLLAANRIASGESYVAGGVAPKKVLGAARMSRDIDLFHDTEAALKATWIADRRLLEKAGYVVRPLRERLGLVEEFGLTLHTVDLATNKVLALVGRLEVRDWIDVIESDARLQPPATSAECCHDSAADRSTTAPRRSFRLSALYSPPI